MIKRLFSSQSKTITGAAIILGLASFVSRLIGVLRDRILAHHFGAGEILDAYYAAFRIPDLIFNLLIAGALSAGFIPVFLRVYQKNKSEAWKVAGSVLNILIILFVVVCGILWMFIPYINTLLFPEFNSEVLALTNKLSRIMLVSPILLGISSVISSILHSLKNFIVFALSPILYNLGIIVGVVAFVPTMGPVGLAWGVILGALLHVSIQIPALLHYGYEYRLQCAWKNEHLREIGRLIVPRTLGLATHQINLLIITVLAATLSAGSITIFNFANNLQYFAIGIIGHSFAIAAFPTLAKLIAENKKADMVDHLAFTIRQVMFLIVPITALFILLRAQIVRVVLGSGQFGWEATILTANTLGLFAISLFAQCLILVLARAFYALHDTWTPFLVSFGAVILNLVLSLHFKDIYGVQGLALAFSITACVQLALLWILLRKQTETLQETRALYSLAKITAAAVLMAIVVQYLKEPLSHLVDMTRFWGILTQGFVAGVVGLLVYALFCRLFKLEEMMLFQNSLRKRWLRARGMGASIDAPEV